MESANETIKLFNSSLEDYKQKVRSSSAAQDIKDSTLKEISNFHFGDILLQLIPKSFTFTQPTASKDLKVVPADSLQAFVNNHLDNYGINEKLIIPYSRLYFDIDIHESDDLQLDSTYKFIIHRFFSEILTNITSSNDLTVNGVIEVKSESTFDDSDSIFDFMQQETDLPVVENQLDEFHKFISCHLYLSGHYYERNEIIDFINMIIQSANVIVEDKEAHTFEFIDVQAYSNASAFRLFRLPQSLKNAMNKDESFRPYNPNLKDIDLSECHVYPSEADTFAHLKLITSDGKVLTVEPRPKANTQRKAESKEEFSIFHLLSFKDITSAFTYAYDTEEKPMNSSLFKSVMSEHLNLSNVQLSNSFVSYYLTSSYPLKKEDMIHELSLMPFFSHSHQHITPESLLDDLDYNFDISSLHKLFRLRSKYITFKNDILSKLEPDDKESYMFIIDSIISKLDAYLNDEDIYASFCRRTFISDSEILKLKAKYNLPTSVLYNNLIVSNNNVIDMFKFFNSQRLKQSYILSPSELKARNLNQSYIPIMNKDIERIKKDIIISRYSSLSDTDKHPFIQAAREFIELFKQTFKHQSDFERYMSFLKYKSLKPYEQLRRNILCFGDANSLKTFMINSIVSKFIDTANSESISQLTGELKGALYDKSLLLIDELPKRIDKIDEVITTLKIKLDSSVIGIEYKGKDTISIDNELNVIINTNYKNILSIFEGDNLEPLLKRFMIIDRKKIPDTKLYSNLLSHYSAKDKNYFMYCLAMRDEIIKFDVDESLIEEMSELEKDLLTQGQEETKSAFKCIVTTMSKDEFVNNQGYKEVNGLVINSRMRISIRDLAKKCGVDKNELIYAAKEEGAIQLETDKIHYKIVLDKFYDMFIDYQEPNDDEFESQA